MTEQQAKKKRGRPCKGDRPMTDAERAAKRRAAVKKAAQQTEFEKQRAQQACEHLIEAGKMLLKYWEKNNGNRNPKVMEAHDLAGESLKHVRAAKMLLSPVWHLYVTARNSDIVPDHDKPAEPKRLICGSTDFERATTASGYYTMGFKELRCPECERRKREFYKFGW